jgi:hypothetical protein
VDMRPVKHDAWLFVGAFALHIVEEAPGFTRWARRYTSARYTQQDFVRNNVLGLAGTSAAALLLTRLESRPIFLAYYSLVLSQQALWNTAFHGGATLAYRAYSPGLLTALGLFLPLWGRITRRSLQCGLLTGRTLLAAAAVGGLVHAAAVAQQVFFVDLRRLPGEAWL